MEESEAIPIFKLEEKSDRAGKPGRWLRVVLVFLPLVFLLVLCFYAWQLKTVYVVDGEEGEAKIQFSTFCRTVGDFLEKNELEVGFYDQLDPAPDEKITNGQVIRIQRAFPARIVRLGSRDGLDGRFAGLESRTMTGNVDFPNPPLQDSALANNPSSEDTPAERNQASGRGSSPTGDSTSEPTRSKEQISGGGPVLRKDSVLTGDAVLAGNYAPPESNLSPAGEQDWARDRLALGGDSNPSGDQDLPGDRDLAGESIPAEKIMEKNVLYSGNLAYEYVTSLDVSATAYCPGTPESGCPVDARGASQCTGFYNDGYTATGVPAVPGDGSIDRPHLVAVDPVLIPLKTLIYIEGFGFARAEDTGAAIKGKSIDILFGLHEEARQFGRQKLKIYILEPHLDPNFH